MQSILAKWKDGIVAKAVQDLGWRKQKKENPPTVTQWENNSHFDCSFLWKGFQLCFENEPDLIHWFESGKFGNVITRTSFSTRLIPLIKGEATVLAAHIQHQATKTKTLITGRRNLISSIIWYYINFPGAEPGSGTSSCVNIVNILIVLDNNLKL